MPFDRDKIANCCKSQMLMCLTVGGAVAGIILGFILRSTTRDSWWNAREIMYIQFPGDIYLRVLNMFILPMLVTSVITGIAALNIQTSWRIAARAALWFVVTDYIAVVTGIILAAAIGPGYRTQELNVTQANHDHILPIDTALDIFRNTFPHNFIEASLVQERTVLIENNSLPMNEWVITSHKIKTTNIPGLITFAIWLGLTISISLPGSRHLLDIIEVFGKSMMIAIGWVTWLTPGAVLFMVTAKLLEEPDLAGLLQRLGLYFITVLIGLFVHGLIILPSIYFGFTRKSPFKLMGNMAEALAAAFGTASSNATLPLTINNLEKRAGLDSRVVRFLAPVASSLNLNGTALYEAVAIVFISQQRGIEISFVYLFLVSITVTAACLGNAGVPQAGLITMVLILGSLGLPPQDVSLIVAVDWLLDRFRTTANVTSDAFATGVVEHLSQEQLTHIGQRKYSKVPQNDEEEEYELNIRL